MQVIIAFLGLLALAYGQGGSGGCQSLGANGELIDSGYVYYLCQDGKLYPKGCVTRGGKRVELGQTGDVGTTRYSCQMKGILPGLEVKACVQKGTEHALGQDFNDGQTAFSCTKEGDEAHIKPVGCADSGKTVKVGEKLTKDDGVYECGLGGGLGRLVKSGCVKDGKQYSVGDSFEQDKVWFNCTRSGAKAAGCVSNGKRLNDGDRFFDNDVIYECYIENGKLDLRVAGCVQHDGANTVERRLNCFWVEGPEPLQYEWTCKHDVQANKAVKLQVRCNYRVSKGVYSIEPGCFRVIDKAAFGCVKQGDGMNLQSFQGEGAEKSAAAAGLRSC